MSENKIEKVGNQIIVVGKFIFTLGLAIILMVFLIKIIGT